MQSSKKQGNDDFEYAHYEGKSGLLYAIRKAGSQKRLAELLGVTQASVSDWLSMDNVKRVPLAQSKKDTGIAKAIAKAGSGQALAQTLGVTQQCVHRWLVQGYAPLERAREIEMQFGVPRQEMWKPVKRPETGCAAEDL